MKKVLCTHRSDGASIHYRIIQPYHNLKMEGIEFKIQNTVEGAEDYDAIVLQNPTDPFLIPMIGSWQSHGKIVVVETDDNYLDIPKSNPVWHFYNQNAETKEYIKTFRKCLELCDYVHVATPELRDLMVNQFRHPRITTVFLNAIDLKIYEGMEPISKPDGMKIIMWGGSTSHNDSLVAIKPIIKKLLKDYVVVMISNKDWIHRIFGTHKNLKVLPTMPLQNYLAMPSVADVYITPLVNDLFSNCKSELKCLEAAVWGIPCVSSNVDPYRRFNDLSGGANLLGNWMQNIEDLFYYSDLYREKSELSRKAIETTYNLETINQQRGEWWKNVLLN